MDENGGAANISALTRLSAQQRACLRLVAEGKTSKEIGRVLALSPSTVDSHVRAAIDRLGARDRVTAARQLMAYEQNQTPSVQDLSDKGRQRSLFSLPPLGGVRNDLSVRRRIYHVVQIAMLGIMGMAAAVVTIAGLVNLFSR